MKLPPESQSSLCPRLFSFIRWPTFRSATGALFALAGRFYIYSHLFTFRFAFPEQTLADHHFQRERRIVQNCNRPTVSIFILLKLYSNHYLRFKCANCEKSCQNIKFFILFLEVLKYPSYFKWNFL